MRKGQTVGAIEPHAAFMNHEAHPVAARSCGGSSHLAAAHQRADLVQQQSCLVLLLRACV